MRFKEFLEEQRDHDRVIKALRSKTVANGATEGEARSASSKADELEQRHKPSSPSPTRSKPRKFNKHREKWTKAQWDAHLDAMERDDR
jgi:hypothetical protein